MQATDLPHMEHKVIADFIGDGKYAVLEKKGTAITALHTGDSATGCIYLAKKHAKAEGIERDNVEIPDWLIAISRVEGGFRQSLTNSEGV